MIRLTEESCIYVAIQPVDFRKQLDGLIAVCEHQLKQSTRTGGWFVFINRARTMVRALVYDQNGYWLATKRLSRGRYQYWPKSMEALTSLMAERMMRLFKNEGDDA